LWQARGARILRRGLSEPEKKGEREALYTIALPHLKNGKNEGGSGERILFL